MDIKMSKTDQILDGKDVYAVIVNGREQRTVALDKRSITSRYHDTRTGEAFRNQKDLLDKVERRVKMGMIQS